MYEKLSCVCTYHKNNNTKELLSKRQHGKSIYNIRVIKSKVITKKKKDFVLKHF